jgi:hypothetical protein
MGTWGDGNFQEDTAADHLSALTSRLIQEVQTAMSNLRNLEPDEYWGCAVPCNVEILSLLRSQNWCGASVPEPAIVEQWKTTYMAVWDRYIDQLAPDPGFRSRRRETLVKTFDDLHAHATKQAEYAKGLPFNKG